MSARENKLQYLELKSKLTALNYTETFKEDAFDLVNRLVADLISTTNSYKIVQEKEVRIAQDLALSQAQLFPLRKENARLARENHDLHNDTIRLNDEIRNATEDSSRQLQRVHEQLQDSRFLCESLNEQLRHKNETIDKLRMAYDAVTDPSLKGPNGLGGANANRAIKMSTKLTGKGGNVAELSVLHHAPQSSNNSTAGAAGSAGSVLAEKETIIKTLRAQLEAANKAFATKDEESKRLASAVAAREQEIARSSRLISSTGAAASRVPTAADASGGSMLMSSNMADQYIAADIANKRIIDQLNGQVDFLNNELAKREAQLVEVNDKLLQYETVKVELAHRSQLLDQARKDASQSTSRIRALEQKVMEYQNVQAEYAAAIEIARSDSASVLGGGSVMGGSAESKDGARDKEGELRLLLGKVSAERDELREEVARLRRITTTLSLPTTSAATEAHTAAAGKGAMGALRSVSATGKRGAVPARGAGGSGAAAVSAAVSTAAARGVGEKERLQAATNVLVIELNSEIESLRKSQQVLNRSVVQREEQIALLTTDRDTWKQRAQTAETGKDRSAAQTMHFELQEKYAQSQVQLADSNRERITLQDFLSAATNDLNGVRKQLAEAQTAREEATTRLTYITRELELTKQTAARRESDLQQTARDTSTLRMECDELREGLQRATAKAETLQRLRDEAQALLDARSAELSEAQSALARLQAESGAAFGGSDVEAQLREDRGRLQSRVKELEAAALISQRESRGLQRVAQSLGVQLQQQRLSRGLDEEQVLLVVEAVAEREHQLERARQELHDAKAAVQRLQSEVSNYAQIARNAQDEVTSLQHEHRDGTLTIAQLQADLELYRRRCDELRERQEDTLQQQADMEHLSAGTAQQLASTRKELQSQAESALRLQQALANAEEERDHLRRQSEEFSRRVKSDRAEITQAAAELQKAHAKCDQLQTLVTQLEAAARREAQRHRSLAAEVEKGGEELQLWEQERAQMQDLLRDRDAKITALQESLHSLDRAKDAMEETCEQLEDALEEQRRVYKHLEAQHATHRQLQEATERKVVALTADLTAAQRHAHASDARVNAAQLEINELKRRFSQKSVEVGTAAHDLMLMTRENQALTSEVVQVSAERDRLSQRLQQVLHASASTEHARRAIEVERGDLLNTYRAVLQDKRKLEEDVHSLSSMKERDVQSVQQLQDKLSALQGTLAAQSAAETRWRGERTALLSQLDTLNDHLVRAQHRIEALEGDNRKMQQDTSGLKQNNNMLNERINMIIKRAGAATEANKMLTGRLSAVERERDAVRALVGIERQRASDLGHIAEAARVDAATKELHIQRMRAVTGTGATSTAVGGTTYTTEHSVQRTYQASSTAASSSAYAAQQDYAASSPAPADAPDSSPAERSEA